MSITILIILLINLFFSHPLPIKLPTKVDKPNVLTSKSWVQVLVVSHYNSSPQHITNKQYCKLNEIWEYKIKPIYFKILPSQVSTFSQTRTLQLGAYAIHAKLSNKESFYHKISLKKASSLVTIIGMLTIWKDLSFQQKLKLIENLHALVS